MLFTAFGNHVHTYFNNAGSFPVHDSVLHLGGPPSSVLLAGDLDLDGDEDQLSINWNGFVSAGLDLTGTGTSWTVEQIATGWMQFQDLGTGPLLLDVDGDGDLDLVDAGQQDVMWLRNRVVEDGAWGAFDHVEVEEETFTYGTWWAGPLGCGSGASILWHSWPWGGSIKWSAYADFLGTFVQELALMDTINSVHLSAADLNGDGSNDLIIADRDTALIWWFPDILPQQLLDSVSLTPFDTLCMNGDPYPLGHALPSGGTWSGAGVAANTYTPNLGTFDLTYTVTDTASGCPMSATQPITAIATPTVTVVSGDLLADCDTSAVQLAASPSPGVWYGLADSTGFVDRSCDVRPSYFYLGYTFTAANGGFCDFEHPSQFLLPNCLFMNMGPDRVLCSNGDTLELTVSGPAMGGVDLSGPLDSIHFWANYLVDGFFYPGHPSGTYVFHGSAVGPMDCPANDSIVVTVVDPPDPHILSSLQFCEGDSTGDILADMPGDYGGVASGSATELGTVQPIQLATGSHAFSFTVTDTNSCVTVLTESIEVVEVPDVTLTLPFGEFFPICSTAVALTGGIPLGGQYSITDDGLSDPASEFDPQLYGIDTVLVTYTVSVPGTPCKSDTTVEVTIEICVGMASGTEEAGSFHLSPNPTSGTCLVRLYSNAPARIMVLDASGRVVQELATATDAMLLDVAQLDQGFYTVCVAQNGVQRTQRLVVY